MSWALEDYQRNLDTIRDHKGCVSCGGNQHPNMIDNDAGEPCCSEYCRILSNKRLAEGFAAL